MDDRMQLPAEMNPPNSRPVITRACDLCRKKRVRCVPTESGCVQCTNKSMRCHFTPISARKKPRRPAGYKHIAELEQRLKNSESLLKELQETRIETESLSHEDLRVLDVFNMSQFDTAPSTVAASIPNSRETNPSNNHLMTTFPVEPWRPDDKPALNTTSILGYSRPLANASPPWIGKFSSSPSSLSSFHELPLKSIALELVEDFFSSFNSFFPLFDKLDFMQQLDDYYSSPGAYNPGRWACINVVLSLSHRFRSMRTLETRYENDQAYGYIRNALTVVSELSIMRPSLPGIQALVGMSITLGGTPNPHTSSILIATAVRLAQAMGLHKEIDTPDLTTAQTEQRRHVFWIAYFLDKDMSLRMGQPFSQDDDDMDVGLPTESLTHLPLGSNRLCTIDFVRSRIGLAIIQGQIYKRLYSVQAARQSETQKATVAEELLSILSYWRSGVPIDFESDMVALLQAPLRFELMHMLVIRFTYINCLVMIDRCLPTRQNRAADAAPELPGHVAFPESICVLELRKAIRLIRITPHGDYACVWVLLHHFFAATMTLLHNVLRSPASPEARSDVRVVQPFIGLLEILDGAEGVFSRSEEVGKMHRVCQGLIQRAMETITMTESRPWQYD